MYCIHCGTQIPDNSKFCPECGKDLPLVNNLQNLESTNVQNKSTNNEINKKTKKKKHIFLGILVALLGILAIATATGISAANTNVAKMISQTVSVDKETAKEIMKVISECQFGTISSIKRDVSALKEINTPIGDVEGYCITTSEADSIFLYMRPNVLFQGVNKDIYVIRYKNVNFYEKGNVVLTMDDYKKSLFITMSEYNQIQTGMTYDEVVAIVGSPGEVLSTSTVAGYTVTMICWYGDAYSGANANVTFSNGKVTAKAQIGLKNASPVAKEETTTSAETTTASEIKTTKHTPTTKETTYQNYSSVTTTKTSIQREDEAVLDPDKEYDVFYDGKDYYYVESKTESSTQVIVVVETSLVPIEPWQDENNQQDIDGYVNTYTDELKSVLNNGN